MLVAAGETLAFRHELARQAVLEATSPPRRVALHRMALDALRSAPGGRRDQARLAHHAAGAGDREAVLAHAPAAARQASDATAHRSAAALYRLALDSPMACRPPSTPRCSRPMPGNAPGAITGPAPSPVGARRRTSGAKPATP